jgi:ankyrin repeat protein
MNSSYTSAFVDAVVKGDESVASHLLSLGAEVNAQDDRGLTALHWASASEEGANLVPWLLQRGAKPEIMDHSGHSALHFHCAKGRLYSAACLLHSGSDPNIATTDFLLTPLHLAVKYGHKDVAKVLLAFGAKSSALDKFGRKPVDIWNG